MSYATKYRPKLLKSIVGNTNTKRTLEKYINKPNSIPKTILFTGESGTGKTTFARALANEIKADVLEYNCASIRGLDEFRELVQITTLAPIHHKWRIVVLDEAHQLPKATQSLLLKPLEDGTKHTIIILCTTNPEKLLPTIKTRCVSFHCDLLQDTELTTLLKRVCKKENIVLKKKVVNEIITAADGSARRALSILESISGLSDKEMLKKVLSYEGSVSKEIVDLCRLLINGTTYSKALEMVNNIEADPETIRRAILGYAVACLKFKGSKAYAVADCFRENYFDTGKSGLLSGWRRSP